MTNKLCSGLGTTLIFTSTVVLSTGQALAEDDIEISLEDLLNIEVTSASKIATPIQKAPATITAYTSSHFDDYGMDVINDLLFTLPGFSQGQDYDRTTVAFRGFFDSWSNNHILHLIDGVPMNDNAYGTAYTWMQPLFTAKTVEVIRGPGSALYGSNATNGVVQMNTIDAADMDESIYARVDLMANNGVSRHQFLAGAEKDNLDFVLAYSFYETQGNQFLSYDGSNRGAYSITNEHGRPTLLKQQTRDNKDDSYLWAKLSIGDEWTIQYHRQTWDFDTGHGWVFWVPDFDEEMNESRDIWSVKYQSDINDNWSQEYVLRHQKHDITWNQRYYPDHAFADYYPSGMWEYLDTETEDLFGRAQFTFTMDQRSTFLVGVELDKFSYDGDNEHYSNINVDSAFFEPFPGDANNPLGPWLDYIKDEPLNNMAFYGQYTSGDRISDDLEVTLGLRYDKLSVTYRDVYGDMSEIDKDWSKTTPRIAVVYQAKEDIVLKALWGKAFRAPTATEMGGAHTFSLAANIAQLEPELITTSEVVVDWSIDNNHVLRASLFSTEFANVILYSTANANLSTNVFTAKNSGVEVEVVGNYGDWNWFANGTFVNRQDETILSVSSSGQPEFSAHPDDITWVPDTVINAGITYGWEDFKFGVTAHYRSDVQRRDSELTIGGCSYDASVKCFPLDVDVPDEFSLQDHRPDKVDGFWTVNANARYSVNDSLDLLVNIDNLFEEDGRIAKTGPFPFDYQLEERRWSISAEVRF